MVSPPRVPPSHGADEPDPTGIRALLGSMPDPGPMPTDLVARITASLAAEQEARAGAVVVPLHRRAAQRSERPGPVELTGRRRRWQRFAVAAAVAAVAVVALPTLVGAGPTSWLASLTGVGGQSSESSASMLDAQRSGAASPATPRAMSQAAPGVASITASGTAYSASTLTTQARAVLTRAGTSTEPAAGGGAAPAATATGLATCLRALGVEPGSAVHADVGTLDGAAAVVAVVSTPTGSTVYAVPPGCDAAHPRLLTPAVPLH